MLALAFALAIVLHVALLPFFFVAFALASNWLLLLDTSTLLALTCPFLLIFFLLLAFALALRLPRASPRPLLLALAFRPASLLLGLLVAA